MDSEDALPILCPSLKCNNLSALHYRYIMLSLIIKCFLFHNFIHAMYNYYAMLKSHITHPHYLARACCINLKNVSFVERASRSTKHSQEETLSKCFSFSCAEAREKECCERCPSNSVFFHDSFYSFIHHLIRFRKPRAPDREDDSAITHTSGCVCVCVCVFVQV